MNSSATNKKTQELPRETDIYIMDAYVKWQLEEGIIQVVAEGACLGVPDQMRDLMWICDRVKPNSILEIGFNAGHSANIFLGSCPEGTVVSMDLGVHKYVHKCKEGIDLFYPGRHTLVVGNSLESLPNLNKRFQPVFDLIFIDGGHSYEVAKQDLENSKKLSHSETIVVMDDTYRSQTGSMEWNEGPNKAWSENIERGHLVEIGSRDYLPGRGMSWGFFH